MGRITLAVNQDTKLRLMKHMVYGDSFDSAINSLIDRIEAFEKRPELKSDEVAIPPYISDNPSI